MYEPLEGSWREQCHQVTWNHINSTRAPDSWATMKLEFPRLPFDQVALREVYWPGWSGVVIKGKKKSVRPTNGQGRNLIFQNKFRELSIPFILIITQERTDQVATATVSGQAALLS